MKTYYSLVIFILLLSSSQFCFSQWTKTSYQKPDLTRTTSRKIISVKNELYVIVEDAVYSSNDEGQTWKNESLNLPEFITLNTISYVAGYLYVVQINNSSSNKNIFRKTLISPTWEKISIRLDASDDEVDIISGNKDTLLISSMGGFIYYSPDQGKTFLPSVLNSSPSRNYDIDVVGSTVLIGRQTSVLKSNNMGATFEIVRNLSTTINIEHSNGKTYFITSRGLFVSNDLGLTRTPILNDSSFPSFTSSDAQFLFNSAFKVINDTFYLALNYMSLQGNKDGVYISTDQGKNWKSVWQQVNNYFGTTSFEVLNGNLYVATLFMGIYKSLDFGLTWNVASTGIISGDTRLSSSISNEIIAKPANASEYSISYNEGQSWLDFPKEMSIYFGKYLDKHFALNESRELITSTDGKNWQNESLGLPTLKSNIPYPKLIFDGKLYLIADKVLYLYNKPNNNFTKLYSFNPSNFTPELKDIEHVGDNVILVSAIRQSATNFFTYGYYNFSNSKSLCWIENTDSIRNILSTYFYSKDNGNTWGTPSGLPQNLADAKVYSDENVILISGKLKVTELANDVITNPPNLTQQVIEKGVSTFYISKDNGVNFKKIDFLDMVSGVDYTASLPFNPTKNDFNIIKTHSSDFYNIYKATGNYFSTDFTTWNKDSSINVSGLNNLIKYNDIFYLGTADNGVLESKDQGKTWIKNSFIPEVDVKLLIVNDLLICCAGKSLYAFSQGKWDKINSDNLPSSITNVGASASNLFVTTRRDGVWKHKMNFPLFVEKSNEHAHLTTSPNPATNYISIKSSVPINGYSVYDISGRMLLEEMVDYNNEANLDISLLETGMYVLKVKYDRQTISKMISIIK